MNDAPTVMNRPLSFDDPTARSPFEEDTEISVAPPAPCRIDDLEDPTVPDLKRVKHDHDITRPDLRPRMLDLAPPRPRTIKPAGARIARSAVVSTDVVERGWSESAVSICGLLAAAVLTILISAL